MTTVQNHIKELLFEQDCVVIPDFGGFVTNFDCAKVDKAEEYIKPAQKWLAFNGLLKNDDGLLSNYIAKNEGVSRDVANLKIKLFVETAKKGIRFNQRFDIAGVGTFTENEEGKIQFNPSENSNFLGDSFGLEKIGIKKSTFIKPAIQVELINAKVSQKTIQQVFASNDRETSAQEIKIIGTHKVNGRKNRKGTVVLKFLLSMFSAALFVSAIYLYDNEKNSLSSFNPFHFSQKQSQKAYAEPIEKVIPKIEPTKSATVLTKNDTLGNIPKPIINDTENRFFVITGSFGETENAENQLNFLKSKGFSKATILKPRKKGRLIKVSAGDFADEESANEEAVKVARATNQNAWIFKK